MIVGIGVDSAEIARVAKSIRQDTFLRRVFAPEERAVLAQLPEHRRNESAAACFAAKEAFLKAAGTGLGGFALAEIAALRHENGAPYYRLFGDAAAYIEQNRITAHLSLTHEAGVATAFAVFERRERGDQL